MGLSILIYLLYGIISILIAIVTIIVVIPFKYAVLGSKYEKTRLKAYFSWIFGGLKVEYRMDFPMRSKFVIRILGFSKKIDLKDFSKNDISSGDNRKKRVEQQSIEENSVKEKKIDENKKSKSGLFINFLSIDVIKALLTTAIGIIKSVAPKKFTLRLKIGFEDPSLTGMAYGFNRILYSFFRKNDISIKPVFDEEVIEGRFFLGGKIWILKLIVIAVKAIFSKPFRYIFISIIKSKFIGGKFYVKRNECK